MRERPQRCGVCGRQFLFRLLHHFHVRQLEHGAVLYQQGHRHVERWERWHEDRSGHLLQRCIKQLLFERNDQVTRIIGKLSDEVSLAS